MSALLPEATHPDTCPVCSSIHGQIDPSLACPRHGHHLIYWGPGDGDADRWHCPAHRCPYERSIDTSRRRDIHATRRKGHTVTEPATIAHHPLPPVTELAIRGDQRGFDKYQLAALRMKGIENVPNPELAVFFHHCKSHGLDPFSGHATMVKFAGKWTIITEIDGFRYLGHRAANQRGDIIAVPEPVYVDTGGQEHRHWVKPPTEPPLMVKVTILKNGAPFTGEANYYEFGQFAKNQDGTFDYTRPLNKTATMPANQTRKCAEAQAWRLAYQDIFAGLPQQFDVQPAAGGDTVVTAEVVQAEPGQLPKRRSARKTHIDDGSQHINLPPRELIGIEFGRLGIEDDIERTEIMAMLTGSDEGEPVDDSPEALGKALQILKQCSDVGQLHEQIAALDDG